jgi:ElaB/YqjD/DUF883 family membrane-anchored ribosome-binding protein
MADRASEIRAEIAEDREALAGTVQELAAKADVKGRIKEKALETSEQLQHKAEGVSDRLRKITPAKARETVSAAAEQVRRRPLPAVAVAALMLGLLLGTRLGKKKGG